MWCYLICKLGYGAYRPNTRCSFIVYGSQKIDRIVDDLRNHDYMIEMSNRQCTSPHKCALWFNIGDIGDSFNQGRFVTRYKSFATARSISIASRVATFGVYQRCMGANMRIIDLLGRLLCTFARNARIMEIWYFFEGQIWARIATAPSIAGKTTFLIRTVSRPSYSCNRCYSTRIRSNSIINLYVYSNFQDCQNYFKRK